MTSTAPVATESHGLRILLILSALLAFASISTDLYLPAMPVMADALHADGGTLELTVSGYLVGFSVGQLFWFGGLPLLVFGCFLFASSTGFIVANSVAGALNCLPEFSGSASALAGGLQYGSGVLGSALVAIYADGTPWPMGWVVAVCGVGCVLSALWVKHSTD